MIEYLKDIPPWVIALCNVGLVLLLAAIVLIKEAIDSSKEKEE